MRLHVASTEYVRVPVCARDGSTVKNPTGDVVSFAFVPDGQSLGTAWSPWNTGLWDPQGSTTPWYTAMCLVGPANGGVVLSPGVYRVFVKISDSPEVPVHMGGVLEVWA